MDRFKSVLTGLWVYLFNILYSLDQLANTLLGGYPDETISSRAGKGRLRGSIFWSVAADLIDVLFLPFETDHCNRSIEWDEGEKVRKPAGWKF
ncbi:MAG: hypothetical protein CMK92_05180 [Pseudomonas sp.]|nr:hypothetical protein [Pseudomonas sp.]